MDGFEPTDNSEYLLMKRSRKEKIPLTSQKNSEAGQVSTILQCLWCNFK